MRISPEFIAAVVFGVIMVIIGLAAIWIVHWQTHVLLRQQQLDIERAQSTVSNVRSDVELSNLSTAPTLSEEPGLVNTIHRTHEGLAVAHTDDTRHL